MRAAIRGLAVVAAFAATPVFALDYRSVEPAAAVAYESPAPNAKKLYVLSRRYPVEVLRLQGDWAKVRDAEGGLAWVQAKALTGRRTVLVTAVQTEIRREPSDKAAIVFKAEKDVALELLADDPAKASPGWAKVRSQDGRSGFVRISQVWGL